MEALGNQAKAYHQQEAQAQHHHSGVFVDKLGQRLRRPNHHRHRHHHCRHGNGDVFYHRHRGNHRVYGKHRIQQDDLPYHRPKSGVFAATIATVYIRRLAF